MDARIISEKEVWQSFIASARPDSFLHSFEWGTFEESLGNKVFRIGVYEGDHLVAVSLWSKITARRGTFLLCPHGPIIASKAHDQLQNILTTLVRTIAPLAKQERCDFIRLSTLTPDTPDNRRTFAKAGFRNAPIHIHSETSWILDLEPTEEQLLTSMKKNTRYSIRKAEKDGVRVMQSDKLEDFDTFWSIYAATVQRQHFVPFPYAQLKKEFAIFARAGKALLFIGSYNDTPVSAAFVMYDAGSGFYHHGGSNQKFPSITASEAVQWAAIREAKKRGCTRYNFWGIVPESNPKHPWYGLTKFKQGFGGRLQSYVPTQDLPLTKKYWLTYAIEKVRKMRRRV